MNKYIFDKKEYIEANLQIKDKESEIIPFRYKYPQQKLYEQMEWLGAHGYLRRAAVLKARQVGISTITGGMDFTDTVTDFNITTAIVAHEDKATSNLFDMYNLFYNNLPDALKPSIKRSNAYELNFNNDKGDGLNSRIVCFTAGGKGIGRSFMINNLHASEFALWPGDKLATLSGLLACVPKTKKSSVVIESTAQGMDAFKDFWDKCSRLEKDENGEYHFIKTENGNNYIGVFVAWFELDEYTLPPPDDFKLTEEERRIKNLYNLTDGQMCWRRDTLDNECHGDLNLFHQEYPANPDEAFIATGDPVFDNAKIIEQRVRAKHFTLTDQLGKKTDKKPRKGIFEYEKKVVSLEEMKIDDNSIKFIEKENGFITIYEEPLIEMNDNGMITKKCPYVIGGDLAKTGKDYFTGKVINGMTKCTAAKLRKQRMDEDLYADQMYCLGTYYHTALIGIETNTSTRPHRVLEMLGYRNVSVREQMDVLENRFVKRTGFETNTLTRPVIVSGLVQLMRDFTYIEIDDDTLGEMLTFVRNDKGKAEASEGKHDDMVMATAIAHFIASQQPSSWIENKAEESTFIQRNFKHKDAEVIDLW